jgi:acetoin utilization deacetylase AcuC-like enzyme
MGAERRGALARSSLLSSGSTLPRSLFRWPAARWPLGRRRRELKVWYHPAYRLTLPSLEPRLGLEPRRADLALRFLLDDRLVRWRDVHPAEPVSFRDLARVHTPSMLEAVTHPDTLARIYVTDPAEMVVDEVLYTVRLAAGGTLAAARHAVRHGGTCLNLLGGFHHAGTRSPGPLCPINDLAVAIAVLRAEGFAGRVLILDLDAHAPDGTADCVKDDPRVYLGSLSGPGIEVTGAGIDDTRLPEGCDDRRYLEALDRLLGRIPAAALAVVLAGGDVLAGDRMGRLGLSLEGHRERDLRVAEALGRTPAVWLPAGGYGQRAWRALAGTGLAVVAGSRRPIAEDYDPLDAQFAFVAGQLDEKKLHGNLDLTLEDLEEDLGLTRRQHRRLLGYYTVQGIEYALSQYGLIDYLERLGYGDLRVQLDAAALGERVRVWGREGPPPAREHVLIETVLERRPVGPRGQQMLYVHWLTLRHPRGHFGGRRPPLPGQEVPGLGLAREVGELFGRMAVRLGLAGVAFRPAHYHTAYAGRTHFRFVDSARQGRFVAMLRDLANLPLLTVSEAAASGRLLLNGQPYIWETDEMASFLAEPPDDALSVEAASEDAHFGLAVATSAGLHRK